MPYINLIQEQRLSAQANERKARSFFFTFVGILVTSGAAYGFLSMESMLVTRHAEAIQLEDRKNAPLVKQLEENQRELNDVTPRLATLTDAQTMTDRWNRILQRLAVQTPSTVWLTSMRCMASDSSKPIQVQFLGVSTNQSPIGEFILRLQNFSDLEGVNLKFTNEKMISTTSTIEFEVDSNLAGSAEKKAVAETQGDQK